MIMKYFNIRFKTGFWSLLGIISAYYFIHKLFFTRICPLFEKQTVESGWITSPSLYEELRSYQSTIENLHIYPKFDGKPRIFSNKTIRMTEYPYSSRICSNTTNQESTTGIMYCLFQNIYYHSNADEYYYFQNASAIDFSSSFIWLDVSYGKLKLNIVNDVVIVAQLLVSLILTKPMFIAGPVDPNYAHGFLETWGPRFWALSEIQHNKFSVNPRNIQFYYTSHMFKTNKRNWELYERQTDGTYRDKAKWSATLQSMFSDFPLLTYKSFDGRNVLFEYFLITGNQVSRTPAWDYYYSISRSFRFHPFHTRQYRLAYLSYSEWILRNLNLTSKFALTPVQQHLQLSQQSERIPICEQHCSFSSENSENIDMVNFTGDWIVVLNRKGTDRRLLSNADELVDALLRVFPDRANRFLRVWPRPYDFNDNLYESARFARSIRLLIGVHGAGLANSLFMRPGAILYEINPLGCRKLSFNFNRWANIFNLQYALWSPSQQNIVFQDDSCHNRQAATTVIVSEIVREVVNLIQNEIEYRNGYLRRALSLHNDSNLINYATFRI